MNKNMLYTVLIALIGMAVALWLLLTEPQQHAPGHDDHDPAGAVHENEGAKGPHGGRLLRDGDFALEITLFEKGVPPEFHLYSYLKEERLNPNEVAVVIRLTRLDGQTDTFNFTPQGDYLRGDGTVTEPHSFDVSVAATYQGQRHEWQYENYEGRIQISHDIAAKSGIETEAAGPRIIKENLSLTGRIQIDPKRLSQVRARFPGVVKTIQHELGEQVQRGDVLAEIQSNESLQTYPLSAPISGIIIERGAQLGDTTTDAPLFIIADLSKVWAELDVFNTDIGRVRPGQPAYIETLSGDRIKGKIDWLSPLAAHASQSIQARVVIDNPARSLRPGQFIRAQVTVAEHRVPLAVRKSALQSFRDFQVVFARIDDTYEVRMLEPGREDQEWIEVQAGLKPGTEYVTQNSYLIKADIEKSGASHDH